MYVLFFFNDTATTEIYPLSLHDALPISPETGSPEMLMELAYRLAAEDTPFIQKIRRDAIVLITPIVETDGHDRMVDINMRSEEHTSELQSQSNLVCRLLLETKRVAPLPS